MPIADVERLVDDLRAQPALLAELQTSGGGIQAVATFAQGKGYDVGADDMKAYVEARLGRDLSDEQLDAIAGGKGNGGGTGVAAYQNTVAATAAVEAAGAVTTVVAAAEVFNLAVGAIVLI